MDLNEIKAIIKAEGGKFIIVEDGSPTIIVMPFEEYKKGLNIQLPESKNTKEDQEENFSAGDKAPEELPEGSLKIEDLPF